MQVKAAEQPGIVPSLLKPRLGPEARNEIQPTPAEENGTGTPFETRVDRRRDPLNLNTRPSVPLEEAVRPSQPSRSANRASRAGSTSGRLHSGEQPSEKPRTGSRVTVETPDGNWPHLNNDGRETKTPVYHMPDGETVAFQHERTGFWGFVEKLLGRTFMDMLGALFGVGKRQPVAYSYNGENGKWERSNDPQESKRLFQIANSALQAGESGIADGGIDPNQPQPPMRGTLHVNAHPGLVLVDLAKMGGQWDFVRKELDGRVYDRRWGSAPAHFVRDNVKPGDVILSTGWSTAYGNDRNQQVWAMQKQLEEAGLYDRQSGEHEAVLGSFQFDRTHSRQDNVPLPPAVPYGVELFANEGHGGAGIRSAADPRELAYDLAGEYNLKGIIGHFSIASPLTNGALQIYVEHLQQGRTKDECDLALRQFFADFAKQKGQSVPDATLAKHRELEKRIARRQGEPR